MRSKKNFAKIITVVALAAFLGSCQQCNKKVLDSGVAVKSKPELNDFFKYKGDGSVIVSGHRGGKGEGVAENSIELFKQLTDQMPIVFEVDPRLTKDSVIILLHDNTLDRTTTGTGKVQDYTYAELQELWLKDDEGEVTEFKIPTLKDAIEWSKGKTVLNLDKKDVPLWMTADLIKELDADDYIMVTVHTGAQSRYYYDKFPGLMQSAFSRNKKEYEDLAICGTPWENMIAYVGRTIDKNNYLIVEKLRAHGVSCMVSYAPTHDKLKTVEERRQAYLEEIKTKPDIIESDLPLEIWELVRPEETK
uniref:glycerophosphodiester phosphodiesterase family protein n=1 Tax=uncultured Draconibacterium sp. TaxID=1573823 RepID=UPI00321790D9